MRLGRKQISLVVGAIVAMTMAAPADASLPKLVGVHGQPIGGKYNRWVKRAKVPLVRGRVQLVFSGCPGRPAFAACVFSRRPRRIYLRPGLRGARRVLYHELGHVFDLTVLNRRERRAFKRIMHLKRARWFGGVRPPAEWFADGYAQCALGRRPRGGTQYGYRPSRRQHAAVCRLVRRAAAPRGTPPQRPLKPPAVVEPRTPPPPPQKPAPPPDSCGIVEAIFGCASPG
jgi:hypothetical protein